MNTKQLLKRFINVREKTVSLCQNLEIEDFVVQPNDEVSPIKWHLGHTSWFFEEIILSKLKNNFIRYNNTYNTIFNSYYKSLGEHWHQTLRGQLSRPTVSEIYKYREYINKEIENIITSTNDKDISFLLELGINHEEQHQELILMDIKFILNINLDKICYFKNKLPKINPKYKQWKIFKEGIYHIGAANKVFSYDNEKPKHKVYVHSFKINTQFVTNNEYKKFIESNGYQKPEFWLSKGWDWVNKNNIISPKYWDINNKNNIKEFTLHGMRALDGNAPVCHINYYEASAYAKWAKSRLPTEQESEIFLDEITSENNNLNIDPYIYHPVDINRVKNNLWWWTKSHYSSYPQYKPFHNNIEEYNEKFMCGQFVLKGGCIATPKYHNRNSYRNFYEPHQRWMFSGIRLARDI